MTSPNARLVAWCPQYSACYEGRSMADFEQPNQVRVASQLRPRRTGTLLLYSDKLAHVRSRVTVVCAGIGCLALAALGVEVLHVGLGALIGIAGFRVGLWIGEVIVTSR